MKVVLADEMARIEKIAYANGANEETFMHTAGRGVAEQVFEHFRKYPPPHRTTLLCGPGNNGGDAYVVGQVLLKHFFHVTALAIAPLDKSRPLCQIQAKRFIDLGGTIEFIKEGASIDFFGASLLVDGILGTGFKGSVKGNFAHLIEAANKSKLPIISIDIPSGINGNTGEIGGIAIVATETVFLGLPKKGCFIGDAWNSVGRPYVFDFGLGEKAINEAHEEFITLTDELVRQMLPKIVWNRHKYQAGYVIGLGGSPGMPGAPTMASFASLRTGAGICRLLHPKGMELEFAHAPLEMIRIPYTSDQIDFLIEKLNSASAAFIGPGIGTSPTTAKMLKQILPNLSIPCVIDAEALTLIAAHDLPLPAGALLTPHHGEMSRLLHLKEKNETQLEFFKQCTAFVVKHNTTLVLKGSPTMILSPHISPFLMTRGDPGMATAGSGDILTGMIAAFLAMGCPPIDAACLGTYVHGMAGEFAAKNLTSYCVIATDLLDSLPAVFRYFLSKEN